MAGAMATPATALEGLTAKMSLAGAPAVTVVLALAVSAGLPVSVAVTDWVPSVPKVMETPLATPAVKVALAGSTAWASVLVNGRGARVAGGRLAHRVQRRDGEGGGRARLHRGRQGGDPVADGGTRRRRVGGAAGDRCPR